MTHMRICAREWRALEQVLKTNGCSLPVINDGVLERFLSNTFHVVNSLIPFRIRPPEHSKTPKARDEGD